MSARSDKVTGEALSLPVELRLELVDVLLRSLNVPTKPEIDRLWAAEAERRIDEVDSGAREVVDGEKVLRQIRKRLSQ